MRLWPLTLLSRVPVMTKVDPAEINLLDFHHTGDSGAKASESVAKSDFSYWFKGNRAGTLKAVEVLAPIEY